MPFFVKAPVALLSCLDMSDRAHRRTTTLSQPASSSGHPKQPDECGANGEEDDQRHRHRKGNGTSDASYHADVDAESQASHRYDRQPSRDRDHWFLHWLRNETTGPQGSQREEAGDEPGNEVTPLKARWTGQANIELRPQQRQEKRHGTEHQHAHEFYHRAELCADWADRHRRGQNLRHGIDRQSRQHAILGFGKPQQGDEQRQCKHNNDTEDCCKSNRGSDIFAIRANDRRDRGDRRIAANRVAARDQDRDTLRQAEGTACCVTGGKGGNDSDCDAGEQRRSRRNDRCQADRRTKQRHCDLEQRLRAQSNTVAPDLARRPESADEAAQENRDNQSFDVRTSKEVLLEVLEPQSRSADAGAQCKPGGKADQRAEDRFGSRIFLPYCAPAKLALPSSGRHPGSIASAVEGKMWHRVAAAQIRDRDF